MLKKSPPSNSPRLIKLDDVRVLQAGQRVGLGLEILHDGGVRLSFLNREHDNAVEFEIPGLVYNPAPDLRTQHSQDLITRDIVASGIRGPPGGQVIDGMCGLSGWKLPFFRNDYLLSGSVPQASIRNDDRTGMPTFSGTRRAGSVMTLARLPNENCGLPGVGSG